VEATGGSRSAGGRRATSADVARAAGVSRTTVSFVLNDTPNQKIPDATRRRVWDAARELGYTPSAAARALRRGRSDIVLGLLPDAPIANAAGDFIGHLAAAFDAVGLTLLAHPRAALEDPDSKVWQRVSPTAVIGFEEFTAAEKNTMAAAGVEAILGSLWSARSSAKGRHSHDERIGGVQAARLIESGCKRIAYAYPADERLRYFADPRLAGVRHACAQAGLPSPTLVHFDLTSQSAAAAASQIVRAGVSDGLGVCAYNDEHALALIGGFRSLGHERLPAIVGVDDIPAARHADPPLTTVQIDLAAISRQAADAVTRILAGRRVRNWPPRDVVRLVPRSSG
jgi:DNA-binding LacI/PurR family transcriptional regulator